MQLHYFPGNASMVPHRALEKIGTKFSLDVGTAQRAFAAEKLSPPFL